MKYHKVLSKNYIKWFHNCHDSATYCLAQGKKLAAKDYLDNASEYLNIIMENWDAIEFFSINDNAFKIDSALPEQFRGYE